MEAGGLDIWVETDGVGRVAGALETVISRVADLRPAWAELHRDWRAHEQMLFHTQGRSVGSPWPMLSLRYAAWKAKFFPGKTILRRTDRLFCSLTAAQHPEQLLVARRHSLEMGTKVPYAVYHQGTGRLAGRGQPTRPVVVMTSAAIHEAVSRLHRYLWSPL